MVLGMFFDQILFALHALSETFVSEIKYLKNTECSLHSFLNQFYVLRMTN